MSRSQQNTVFKQEQGENQGYNANAQTSYNTAQANEQNFENQLAKTEAENPYVQGGQFQTVTNQELTNTADAGSQAAGNAIQSAAVRTGQNPAGAIAATEAITEANTRNLGSQEAAATKDRLASGAAYNQNMLTASEQPASFEAQLAGQQGQLAQGAAGTQEQAAGTPSFSDMLGSDLLTGGTAVGANWATGKLSCWIAAELFGGWEDPRTILVREWLWVELAKSLAGALLLKAYMRYGESIAAQLRTKRWLRKAMQYVFLGALRRAESWIHGAERAR